MSSIAIICLSFPPDMVTLAMNCCFTSSLIKDMIFRNLLVSCFLLSLIVNELINSSDSRESSVFILSLILVSFKANLERLADSRSPTGSFSLARINSSAIVGASKTKSTFVQISLLVSNSGP